MIANEWLVQRHVETPNVVADITQFIAPEFTQANFDTLGSNECYKLTVLAERLEFIEHLTEVSVLLVKHKRTKRNQTPLHDGRIMVNETYSIMIDRHEFAGFDFDSDALSVYLLLTCIDTIKGQPNYVNSFDWLKKRCENESSLDWDMLSDEYDQEHGLSKRFKEAFTNDCSPELRKAIAENFAVARIAAQNIKSESASAWNERSEIDRVKRIASELYTIRSRFTHASLRSFSPMVPVSNSLDIKGPVLLKRLNGPPLKQVLTDVIKYLAKIHIIDRNRGQHGV